MKRIVLTIVVIAMITIGLSAGTTVGINLKGFDNLSPMISAEVGWGSEFNVVSPYLQIGIAQGSALLGMNLKIGKSPAIVYGGAGVTLGTQVINKETNVVGEADVWGWATLPVSASGSYEDTVMIVLPTAEIGIGIDQNGLMSKIGFTYVGNGDVNNYGFTFTMAGSF
jgi:hypothetical protein